MMKNMLVKNGKPNRIVKYSYCPQCGRKGLYSVVRQYSRCRYCGLYRMMLPGQDA
jgi:uncharacterized protein (DUF983 family)